MIAIGIDPGKEGAMAVIDTDDFSLKYHETINIYKRKVGQYPQVLRHISERKGVPVVCCLEHVSAMPGNGSVSMFNFGSEFGYIKGLLEAFEIPYELVRPQKWKKEYSVTKDKNTSIAVCQRLFPTVSLKATPRCIKPDDNMAEALLMAEYARRKLRV